MDRISALLDGPRARGAFVIRCLLAPPWSIAIRDEAPLTIVAVVRGEAWITQAGVCSSVPTGSVALIVGPEPYEMSSSPGLPHEVVITPGQHCETLDGESLEMSMRLGVRSWGHSLDAETVLVTGTYEHHSALAVDVLAGLATPMVVARPDPDPLVDLLARELTHDAPGQQTVLDRLLDALTVDTLRAWYVRQGCDAPAWWIGHHDVIVGDALCLIHDRPENDWTIGSLAGEIGTSRANLARRFSSLVGEPVGAYLTNWRMALAADLLSRPGSSVTHVAGQVGYATPFGFSSAFKRRYGISPTAHRDAIVLAERPLLPLPARSTRL
jgi:AraC-like DNA-binding protein